MAYSEFGLKRKEYPTSSKEGCLPCPSIKGKKVPSVSYAYYQLLARAPGGYMKARDVKRLALEWIPEMVCYKKQTFRRALSATQVRRRDMFYYRADLDQWRLKRVGEADRVKGAGGAPPRTRPAPAPAPAPAPLLSPTPEVEMKMETEEPEVQPTMPPSPSPALAPTPTVTPEPRRTGISIAEICSPPTAPIHQDSASSSDPEVVNGANTLVSMSQAPKKRTPLPNGRPALRRENKELAKKHKYAKEVVSYDLLPPGLGPMEDDIVDPGGLVGLVGRMRQRIDRDARQ
ncbi:hypothetical protein G7Y89_g13745 [Cudoniella acicularis]|uniref:Uncharacterized protein n=1 Tax=Cudoniella acicularis TaxID=354080 RepID=A0A8H4R6B5_9HELO|nr:hypothetical protein G7Y89_g13745 [Cudoniella acicularis]